MVGQDEIPGSTASSPKPAGFRRSPQKRTRRRFDVRARQRPDACRSRHCILNTWRRFMGPKALETVESDVPSIGPQLTTGVLHFWSSVLASGPRYHFKRPAGLSRDVRSIFPRLRASHTPPACQMHMKDLKLANLRPEIDPFRGDPRPFTERPGALLYSLSIDW